MVCKEDGCGAEFPSTRLLKAHVRIEHPDVSYECAVCPYRTEVVDFMNKHQELKHKVDGNSRCCEVCGKTFLKHYHYRIHMVQKHGKQDPTLQMFECEVEGCSYKTYARYILEVHMRKHVKDKPFSCSICGRKLKSEVSLQKHVQKVHLGVRPFICDVCGVSYGEEHELKNHIRRHGEEKQFKCDQCSYSTHDKGNYQNHLFIKHQVRVGRFQNTSKCDVCGFETASRTRFEAHMNAHKGVRAYKCNVCGEAFFAAATLREHKNWKHGDVRFKCRHCSFSAPSKSHVVEHERYMHTHRHVKPYKCSYCDYRCNLSGNCRKHIANRHPGQPIVWVRVCEKWDSSAGGPGTMVEERTKAEEVEVHSSVVSPTPDELSMPPLTSLTELKSVTGSRPSLGNQAQTHQQLALQGVVMNLTNYANKAASSASARGGSAKAMELPANAHSNPPPQHPGHPLPPPPPTHVTPVTHFYSNEALQFLMGLEGQASYASALQYNAPISSASNHDNPPYRS